MGDKQPFIGDFHIHSYLSRATSKRMRLGPLASQAQIKGITVLGTGDFTHPAWYAHLKERLEPAEEGLYRLREDVSADEPDEPVPSSCRAEVRFILSCEISNIYKRNDKTRKVHNLVFMPNLEAAARFNEELGKIGNIRSDGRPILGLDSEDLLRMVIEASPEAFLIPAHVWTPHFSVFGAASAFTSLEECYGSLTHTIKPVETGLSSDPPMNWRLSALDNLTLISNSDAHSPEKLGREANLFHTELSYGAIYNAIATGEGFEGTIEFFPEEGKYHLDGHRSCDCRLTPKETRKADFRCPDCGKKVTVGVLHRVEELADRPEGKKPANAKPFESQIPLVEILSEIIGSGPKTKKVARVYNRLVAEFGGEFRILREAPISTLSEIGGELLGEAIRRVRQGNVDIKAGFDGQFGVVRVFSEEDRKKWNPQGKLF